MKVQTKYITPLHLIPLPLGAVEILVLIRYIIVSLNPPNCIFYPVNPTYLMAQYEAELYQLRVAIAIILAALLIIGAIISYIDRD